MATKFKLEQVDGSSHFVDCPDPNWAMWEWMEPLQFSLTGRGVQQGRLKVTLHWDLMSDQDFSELLEEWFDAMNHGYRFESITVPRFRGSDNSVYVQYFGAGTPGGYISMQMPTGQRQVLQVDNVEVTFINIMED